MIVKPLWTVTEDEDAGGSDDADEEEPDDADQGADDSGDEEEDGDEGEEHSDKAKAAIRRQKDTIRELRKELREARKKDEDSDSGDAEEKAAALWKPRVVNAAAKTALLEAGADKPDRLLKLLDHEELDVTNEGTVRGLDDEVDRLREEYPELFEKRTRRAGRIETGDRSGGKGARRPKTASERQAASILGH